MKKAFVLGGTVPHIELINKLKARGYHVTLIDYYDNPPAKAAADAHVKASTLDLEAVKKIAEDGNADLVISSCIDQANSVACYVAEQLNLPHPYTYAKSLEVTRKGLMKTIFKQNGIPTSDFYLIDKDEAREIQLPFPFVIKPTDANSSKGVFKINSKEEFYEKIEESICISREGKAIVEGFVTGTEIQVDCVVIDHKAHVLMTSDKVAFDNGGRELQVTGFSVPGIRCEYFSKRLQEIAQGIADSFELDNTPFFYQAICDDKEVYVLEFAPRLPGGTRFETVKLVSGFDYIESSIRSFLKEPIVGIINAPKEKYVMRFLYMKPGVFDHIKGIEDLLEDGTINHFFPFVIKGKQIDSSMSSGNRICAIMTEGKNYEEAERKVADALERLAVIDVNGNDLSYWKEV